MQYLKDRSYYEELYDLGTIQYVLHLIDEVKNSKYPKYKSLKHFLDKNKKDLERVLNLAIWAYTGERYCNKEKIINEWMERDRVKQELYDCSTPPPRFCEKCETKMEYVARNLHGSVGENLEVHFALKCPHCKEGIIINHLGKRIIYEKPKCPSCNSVLKQSIRTLKTKTIWKDECSQCSYIIEEIDDHKKWEKEKQDKELLNKYRDKFCLSKKEGDEFVYTIERLKSFRNEQKRLEKKRKDPRYIKAKKLKKLTLIQVKRALINALAKNYYQDLQFGKPNIGKYVIVDFSVNNTKEDRHERDSQNILKKTVISALKDTNWRLMSDGVNYRLGILTGRLKAYEQEDDLMHLIKKNG
jgi:hypothetical protein